MATYLTSALFHQTKFCIEDVLNATLAGGVAMGSSADLILHPYGGLLVGLAAGIISTLGYNKLMPFLQKKLKLFDTCGINNLHGIPGLLGGFTSVIVLGTMEDPLFEEVFGRSQQKQALMQLAGIGVSLGIAVLGGLLVSAISKLKLCKLPRSLYNDDEWWDLREVEVEDKTVTTIRRQSTLLRSKTMEMQALSTGNPSLPDSPANNPLVSKPFDFEQQPNGKKE
jgi:ammonium transporter Rh